MARENVASWMYHACRGICHDPVEARLLAKSIGCGKTFVGPKTLKSIQGVFDYVEKLSLEIAGRTLEAHQVHGLIPTMMGVSWHLGRTTTHRRGEIFNITGNGGSKSGPFPTHLLRGNADELASSVANRAQSMLKRVFDTISPGWGCTGLSLSAFKFQTLASPKSRIDRYFSNGLSRGVPASSSSSTDGGVELSRVGRGKRTRRDIMAARSTKRVRDSGCNDDREHVEKRTFGYDGLSVSDLDPSVLASLPKEMRSEVLRSVRASSKKKMGKQNPTKTRLEAWLRR